MTNREAIDKATQLWPSPHLSETPLPDLVITLCNYGGYSETFQIVERGPYEECDDIWGEGDTWEEAFAEAIRYKER